MFLSVIRWSTIYLAQLHVETLGPQWKKLLDSYNGWYEGYAAGVPIQSVDGNAKFPYGKLLLFKKKNLNIILTKKIYFKII